MNDDASPSLIALYCKDSAARGLQPTTIEMRDTRLRAYAVWLDRPLGTATPEDIRRFLDGRDIGARTRYAWLSHLSCFYRWAIRHGHLDDDPTTNIDRPRLPRLLPRPITDENLTIALKAADGRMRAMILLAAYMGLRCREIANIHANDLVVGADEPMLLVHGKGQKDRLVPLHPAVLAAVVPLPKRGWLFLTPDGRQLTPQRVSRSISHHLHWHGVDATGHQLRHWFATRIYRETLDLRLTQELMGHASPTTTSIYTAWAKRDAAAAVKMVGLDPPVPV